LYLKTSLTISLEINYYSYLSANAFLPIF